MLFKSRETGKNQEKGDIIEIGSSGGGGGGVMMVESEGQWGETEEVREIEEWRE